MVMCLELLLFTGGMVFVQEIRAQCVMTDVQYVMCVFKKAYIQSRDFLLVLVLTEHVNKLLKSGLN